MSMRVRKMLAVVGAVVLALLVTVPVAQAADPQNGTCNTVLIPVSLQQGGPANQQVSATYCTPNTWAAGPHAADLLVAGATYNKLYWDWPISPELYSYVDKTLEAGRATLAFDRIGTGQSSFPANSLQLTLDGDAYVLHQLVSWIRNQGVEQVNGIGHSLGSATLTKAAGTYQDFDKVVVTGILHFPAIGLGSTTFLTSLQPAALDPAFSGKNLDLGYLTTVAGRRGPAFYDLNYADPQVVAYDEAHKDLASAGQTQVILELETPALLNATKNITAPVLVVMGATDNIFCNLTVNCASAENIKSHEAAYYRNAESLDAVSIPQTAHNLTLHPSANDSFAAINNWLK